MHTKFYFENLEGNHHLGVCTGFNWQVGVHWRTLVNTVMWLKIPQIISWVAELPFVFQKRTLYHGVR